jgi:bifunctional DNA-binding transcriptional regulator/antitoxin component of YhaV-PrlF toxin-antitoxin module
MTSKGQFTLPANVREAMKLRKQGDKLLLDFSPDEQQAILSKPVSFTDIQAKAKTYIKQGTKPLHDAKDHYETREPRL